MILLSVVQGNSFCTDIRHVRLSIHKELAIKYLCKWGSSCNKAVSKSIQSLAHRSYFSPHSHSIKSVFGRNLLTSADYHGFYR